MEPESLITQDDLHVEIMESVISIEDRYDQECSEYHPSPHELLQLAAYWLSTFFRQDMAYFFDCSVGSTDYRWTIMAHDRFETLYKLMGREAMKEVVVQVDLEMHERYGGYWDVFKAASPFDHLDLAPTPNRDGVKSSLFHLIDRLPLLGSYCWDVPGPETILWCTLDQLSDCNDPVPAKFCGRRLNGAERGDGEGIEFPVGISFASAVSIVRAYCGHLKTEMDHDCDGEKRPAYEMKAEQDAGRLSEDDEAFCRVLEDCDA